MIVLFNSRTNRLQETYIVGNLRLLKPGTIRRGHETYSNQQLLVKGLPHPNFAGSPLPNLYIYTMYITTLKFLRQILDLLNLRKENLVEKWYLIKFSFSYRVLKFKLSFRI